MTRDVRTHLPPSTASGLVPKHLTKQEFAKRLYGLMNGKGWHQSELARQSGLSRDSISTYINGHSLPTPKNLAALATALGVDPVELLPNQIESAIDRAFPSFELTEAEPGRAWLRINRQVSTMTAIRIGELLDGDRAVDIFG